MKCYISTRISVVAAALLTTGVLCHAGDQGNADRILTALLKSAKLKNINIIAQETNHVFNQFDPAAELLESSSKLSKEVIARIRPLAAGRSAVLTYARMCVYKFRQDTVLVTASGLNPQTKLIAERTLVTPGQVFVSRTFVGTKGTNTSYQGEIYPRLGKTPIGWPFFLSKATLADWLSNAPGMRCDVSVSSRGANCYVVTLPAPVESPVNHYALLFRVDGIQPLELRSYLANEKLYSISELEFHENARPSFCKRARTQVFSGDQVFKETTWELIAVEDDASPLNDSVNSFFAVGTHVSDRRFAKPIDYTYGTRLPNEAEIKAMLATPRGIAKYERATHSKAELEEFQATRLRMRAALNIRKAAVRVVIVSVGVLAPLFLAFRVYQRWRSDKPG